MSHDTAQCCETRTYVIFLHVHLMGTNGTCRTVSSHNKLPVNADDLCALYPPPATSVAVLEQCVTAQARARQQTRE